MNIKPIKTKVDYRSALKEIECLMTALPNIPQGERLDVLATLVETYERMHHPLDEELKELGSDSFQSKN